MGIEELGFKSTSTIMDCPISEIKSSQKGDFQITMGTSKVTTFIVPKHWYDSDIELLDDIVKSKDFHKVVVSMRNSIAPYIGAWVKLREIFNGTKNILKYTGLDADNSKDPEFMNKREKYFSGLIGGLLEDEYYIPVDSPVTNKHGLLYSVVDDDCEIDLKSIDLCIGVLLLDFINIVDILRHYMLAEKTGNSRELTDNGIVYNLNDDSNYFLLRKGDSTVLVEAVPEHLEQMLQMDDAVEVYALTLRNINEITDIFEKKLIISQMSTEEIAKYIDDTIKEVIDYGKTDSN